MGEEEGGRVRTESDSLDEPLEETSPSFNEGPQHEESCSIEHIAFRPVSLKQRGKQGEAHNACHGTR